MFLLRGRFREVLNVGSTLIRVLLISATVGLGIFIFIRLPVFTNLSTLMRVAAAGGTMAVGLLIVVPFIWPEVKLLLQLGTRE